MANDWQMIHERAKEQQAHLTVVSSSPRGRVETTVRRSRGGGLEGARDRGDTGVRGEKGG